MATDATPNQPSAFTCIACRLQFEDALQMREHYKKEFHRFNIKRKALNLPPVPEDLYDQKVANASEAPEAQKGSTHLKQGKKRKDKNLATSQALENQEPPQEEPQEELNDEQLAQKIANAERIPITESLFDGHRSQTFQQNLQYMTHNFGFFIPAIDHVIDIEGLLLYLAEKVAVGCTCIYCDKPFGTLQSVRQHMSDAWHCQMQWDDQTEYEDWYKFPKPKTIAECINENGEIENSKLYVHMEKAYIEPSGELVLSSGAVIGHRAYRVLYNQRRPNESHAQLVTSLMQEHKRLAAKEYQKRVNMDQKYIRRQNAMHLKVGLHSNQQKHFREQNPIV